MCYTQASAAFLGPEGWWLGESGRGKRVDYNFNCDCFGKFSCSCNRKPVVCCKGWWHYIYWLTKLPTVGRLNRYLILFYIILFIFSSLCNSEVDLQEVLLPFVSKLLNVSLHYFSPLAECLSM